MKARTRARVEKLRATLEALLVAEPPTAITSPTEAWAAFAGVIPARARQEHFAVAYLDGRRRLISTEVISKGTATACLVHPRDVFYGAITAGAVSIVVAHNHPSGDPAPSTDDRLLTERLSGAGKILGINVDDHIILGRDGRFFSFREHGMLV